MAVSFMMDSIDLAEEKMIAAEQAPDSPNRAASLSQQQKFALLRPRRALVDDHAT
jgi:hypothetical protein